LDQPLTEKADIYGMGMVFYSLIAGREPYDSQESFKLALFNRTRPEIDPSWHKGFMKVCLADICSLVHGCWGFLPGVVRCKPGAESSVLLSLPAIPRIPAHVRSLATIRHFMFGVIPLPRDGLNVECALLILNFDAVSIKSISTRQRQ